DGTTSPPEGGGNDAVTSDADGGAGDAGPDAADASSADGGAADAGLDTRDASGADGVTGETGDGGAPPEVLFVATHLGGIPSFTVDGLTGRLVPAAGSPYDTGAQLYALAVHPSGRFAYATDLRGTVISYAVTPGTGVLAHLPGSPITIGDMAIAAAL